MKKLSRVTLRLEVTIDYELFGTDPLKLEDLLQEWPVRMSEVGMMTRDTNAEINDWDSKVVWVNEVLADDPDEE